MPITRWTVGGIVVVAALVWVVAYFGLVTLSQKSLVIGSVTLSMPALVIGSVTWGGGVAAWLLTAVFEFRSRYAIYREKKAQIRGACERDPEYANTVGNLEAAVENHGFPRPRVLRCLYFTAYQPLLTLAIVSIPTFRPPDFSAWVPFIVNVFAMVIVLVLTILHEIQWREENLHKPWHQKVTLGVWVAYLVLILWLAQVCQEPDRTTPQQPILPGASQQPFP